MLNLWTCLDFPVKRLKEELQKGNEHILLIDDEEEIVIMEKQILKHFGYQVTSYTSSVEAL